MRREARGASADANVISSNPRRKIIAIVEKIRGRYRPQRCLAVYLLIFGFQDAFRFCRSPTVINICVSVSTLPRSSFLVYLFLVARLEAFFSCLFASGWQLLAFSDSFSVAFLCHSLPPTYPNWTFPWFSIERLGFRFSV